MWQIDLIMLTPLKNEKADIIFYSELRIKTEKVELVNIIIKF